MADFLSLFQSSKNAVFALIAFVLAFDLAFVGQKLGGAYQSEFGGAPKEASHYMAGLFWRDLAVSLRRDRAEGRHESLSEEKKSFTQAWAAHYPSLQNGTERSLFHGLEGVWMLALPATRGALLVLMALLAGILATQVFRALQPEYGWIGGGVAAVGILVMPLTREFTGVVGPEILSAVLLFGAAMAFGEFIDKGVSRSAWLAGILGGMAILTSGESGVFDCFIVLFACGLLTRNEKRFAPALWGMIILTFAASLIRALWTETGHVDSREPFRSYAIHFVGMVGWGGLALIIFGCFLRAGRGTKLTGSWCAAVALLASSVGSRDLFLALPAAVMLAVAGGASLAQWVGARPMWGGKGAKMRVSFAVLLAALALLSAAGSWKRNEPCTGFAPLAEMLISDAGPEDVTLVSSDPIGEERFMAELAMREERPGHKVLYGTRVLAVPGKKFLGAETALPSDEAVFNFLTSGKIKYVMLDDALPDEARREHHYQIRRAIEEHLTRFWVVATCPVTRDGVTEAKPAKLYKIQGIK